MPPRVGPTGAKSRGCSPLGTHSLARNKAATKSRLEIFLRSRFLFTPAAPFSHPRLMKRKTSPQKPQTRKPFGLTSRRRFLWTLAASGLLFRSRFASADTPPPDEPNPMPRRRHSLLSTSPRPIPAILRPCSGFESDRPRVSTARPVRGRWRSRFFQAFSKKATTTAYPASGGQIRTWLLPAFLSFPLIIG